MRVRPAILCVSLLIGAAVFIAMSPELLSVVASGGLGHSYYRGDLVRVEYDGYKAVYRVDRPIDNNSKRMYALIATDDAGMLPSLSAEESALRLEREASR